MKRFSLLIVLFLTILIIVASEGVLQTSVVKADGLIDFESGIDGQVIQSSIPGLQFTTTAGYDWIYGDWRTGNYNGPYPPGPYYSNGNFFAWLGPNQGAGRIDFTQGCATYLQVWVSSNSGLIAEAYYSDGILASTASVPGNLYTGQLERLRVEAPPGDCFSYVILHDSGNNWLIDDLSTDAAGVPSTRPPVIFLPGLTGSRLDVHDTCENEIFEVWPAPEKMLIPFNTDAHLNHLMLDENGTDPLSTCDQVFVNRTTDTKTENGAIRKVGPDWDFGPFPFDFYAPLIDHLELMGFEVYTYGYDWRLDLRNISDNDLDDYIDSILTQTGASQVNIVAHSLGGLLARYYITSNPVHADKVEQVISLGTPYLGAPKALRALRWGDTGEPGLLWGAIGLYAPRVRDISQNSPSMYQILPTENYFHVNGGGYYSFNGDMKSWSQTHSMIINEHNAGLAQNAESFHNNAMDDWGSTPTGVAYRVIVGSGKLNTPGILRERAVLDWFGHQIITWEMQNINGDGTVPLHSADLRGNGYDYSGGTPIWYANGLDHMAIAKEQYILDFVGAILATPPNSAAMEQAHIRANPVVDANAPVLYSGSNEQFAQPQHLDNTPPVPPEMSYTPFEVHGGQITVSGAVEVHVYDYLGNHTGAIEEDKFEVNILGSSYTAIGDLTIVTVPFGSTYIVEIESSGAQDFDLKVQNMRGLDTNLIQRTIVYADAPIGSGGLAELAFNPDNTGAAPELAIDFNRDGIVDQFVPATGDLDPIGSTDVTAPSISISLDGQIGPQGWYIGDVMVTITSVDSESGLAKVEYSINNGETIHRYTDPFVVNADAVPLVVSKATDFAGNEGWARATIGPTKTFLPAILKN